MSRLKYVTQDLFDERTRHITEKVDDIKKDVCDLKKDVRALNNWKLKVVVGSTVIGSLVGALISGGITLWRLLIL